MDRIKTLFTKIKPLYVYTCFTSFNLIIHLINYQRGLFGEYLDWGQRFGDNKEWGIRITTENINGRTSVKGTKINGQGIFANIDHTTEKSKDKFIEIK